MRPAIAALTFVDDTLKANHGEQTAAHGGARNQAQDNHSEQASSVPAGRLLEELPFICGGSHSCRWKGGGKGYKRSGLLVARPRHVAFERAIISTRFQLRASALRFADMHVIARPPARPAPPHNVVGGPRLKVYLDFTRPVHAAVLLMSRV